jgi:DNA-binding transcriptional LysR family regulator
MDKLRSMAAFAQVVAENGFAAGARKLGVSPSGVTRLVNDLEAQLGVRLLQRTARRLALTPAGEIYLDRVLGVLSGVEEAEELVRSHASAMSGSIRVCSLPGLAPHLVAPALAEFRSLHPDVSFEVRSDPQASRSIETNDITLLTDQIAVPAETVVRRVLDGVSILCASPAYLGRRGAPKFPQDLCAHDLARLSLPEVASDQLLLHDQTDPARQERVACPSVLTCDDHDAVLRATLDGVGISSQALQVAAPLLRSGQLQRVLAPWISERFTLVAAFASRRYMPMRTRAFLDHLIRYAGHLKEASA